MGRARVSKPSTTTALLHITYYSAIVYRFQSIQLLSLNYNVKFVGSINHNILLVLNIYDIMLHVMLIYIKLIYFYFICHDHNVGFKMYNSRVQTV